MNHSFKTYQLNVTDHYTRNWGDNYCELRWPGVMNDEVKAFCVLEFPPTSKRKMWTYATCGMSDSTFKSAIELHIFSEEQDSEMVELLTVVAYYHRTEANLDLNHTVNFGRPWKQNSQCDHGLISMSYLDGPDLGVLSFNDDIYINFYWLIPVTKAEVAFKRTHGIEQLEQRFDNDRFNYLDAARNSVV